MQETLYKFPQEVYISKTARNLHSLIIWNQNIRTISHCLLLKPCTLRRSLFLGHGTACSKCLCDDMPVREKVEKMDHPNAV